jgi:hydrogenase expression/formation protein HypD
MNRLMPFRDATIVQCVASEIRRLDIDRPLRFMEVCGGHTAVIYRFGLTDFLPPMLELVSGPGCPVCVTANDFVDHAIALADLPDVTLATFGDLVRVPGSTRSLAEVRAHGADVRVFYSSADALTWASEHRERTVVFLGIVFETTACTLAATLAECIHNGIKNFGLLSALKTMPGVLRTLLSAPDVQIDGFILPGHVATVIGLNAFRFIPHEFFVPCVVSGFEPSDLMESICMLCRQIEDRRADVENQYRRVVRHDGNPMAQALMDEIFEPCDMAWRGFGIIPESGLKLRPEFSYWDSESMAVEVEPFQENHGCRCGDVLCGRIHPSGCALFGTACTPETPCGACMVSSEGACATCYHFAPVAHERQDCHS